MIDVTTTSVTNGTENNGGVQTQSVLQVSQKVEEREYKRNIQNEPRASSSEEDFAVLPLTKMANEVVETGFGGPIGGLFNKDLRIRRVSDVAQSRRTMLAADVLDSIGGSDFLVTVDIESVTNSFGDCETEVEGKASGHSTESVDDTPRLIEGNLTSRVASSNLKGILEADGANECNEGSCELSPSLIGKNSGHHCATPSDGCELTCNDG